MLSKFSPGSLSEPISENRTPCKVKCFLFRNECLYSMFRICSAVPLLTLLPIPLIFKKPSNTKGEKGLKLFVAIPKV